MERIKGPVGALITELSGKKYEKTCVDFGGCDPGSNLGSPVERIAIYRHESKKIKNIFLTDSVVSFDIHGDWSPPRVNRRDNEKIKYSDDIEIILSKTVKHLKLFGIGNIKNIKIPRSVKKIEINFCKIETIEFQEGCNIEELLINCSDINKSNCGSDVWPDIKDFIFTDSIYTAPGFKVPDTKCVLVEGDYGDASGLDIFSLNTSRKINIIKQGESFYGFGLKMSKSKLISICSEAGFTSALEHFGLKPVYPIKSHKHLINNYEHKYLSEVSTYDEDEEEWINTGFHSLPTTRDGTPVINMRFQIRTSTHNYTSTFPFFNKKTGKIDFEEHCKVDSSSLTRERYDDLLNLLSVYYGEDYMKHMIPGDISSDEGMFSGLMLHDMDYKFREVVRTTIKDLDWSLMPNSCNILTMTEDGEWWGNEREEGLEAEGGSWVTYGGTGNRWPNVCEESGVEIEPVSNWRKMYKRPKNKIVPKKPKVYNGPELCPFSSNPTEKNNFKDIPTSTCSRTADGSRGDCSTCRVAADWEMAYG